MTYEERLFQILRGPHISEKASTVKEKTNTFVFKVLKDATKAEIKAAVKKFYGDDFYVDANNQLEILGINTVLVKGKIKRRGKQIGRCSDWKKAYVTVKAGQVLRYFSGAE